MDDVFNGCGSGGGFDQVSLDIWIADHLVLHLESSKGSLQLVFSGMPCFFFDKFSQGINACLCAEEGC